MRTPVGLTEGFNRLWGASALSNLGDGVRLTALPLLAATLTRDPALVAGIALAGSLPWLLLALIGGAVVDRLDRRLLMGYVEMGQMVLVGILALAVATGNAALPLLYAVSFLLGVGEVLFDNAAQAILPALVPRDDLERANGRLLAGEVVGNQFAGPPLGGFLFAIAAALPFILDTVALLAGALLILAIPGNYRPPGVTESAPSTIWSQILEGLRWLWGHRLLRTLAIMVGVMNMLWTAGFSIFVLFALDILGVSGPGYGTILAAGAVGSLVATATGARVARALGSGPALIGAVLLSGAMFLVIGMSSHALVVGVANAIMGYGIVLWNVITVSLRQAVVPDRLLGRANSVYRLLAWGTMPVGAALGGILGRTIGLRAPFLFGGTAVALMAALSLRVVNSASIAEARRAAG